MSTIDLGTMDPALKEALRNRLRQRLRERLIQRTSAAHRVGAAPPVTGATADFGPQTPLSSVDFSGLPPESEDFMGAGAQRETVNAAVRDLYASFPEQGERFNTLDPRDLAKLAMREATPAAMRTMRPAPEPGGFGAGLRQGAALGLDRMSGLPVIGPSIQKFVDETALEQPAAGFGGFAGQAIGSLAGMANPANLPETVLSGVVGRGVGAAARPLIERVNRTLGPTAAGLIERITEEAGEEAAFGATQQAAKEDWVNDPVGAAGRTLAAAGLGGAAGAVATGGVSAGRGAARIAGRGIQAAGNSLRRGATGTVDVDPSTLDETGLGNLTPEERAAAGVVGAGERGGPEIAPDEGPGLDLLEPAPPEGRGVTGDALPVTPARRGENGSGSDPAGSAEQGGGARADSTDLESMTLAELNRLARERGVTPANRRSKRAVMAAIQSAEESPGQPGLQTKPRLSTVPDAGATNPPAATETTTTAIRQPDTRGTSSIENDQGEASSSNRTREPWEMTREEYVAQKMPANPMGGGVNEHILARKHAIHVENAIAAGKKPSMDRVREMAEFFNSSNSNFPPNVLADYPELATDSSPATLRDAGTEATPERAVSTPESKRRETDVAPDEQGSGRAASSGTPRGSPAPRLPKRGEFSRTDIERQLIREYDSYFPESGSELSDADAEQAGTDTLSTRFAGPYPSEIKEWLATQPPRVRQAFKQNVGAGNGRGLDVFTAMGADRYFEAVAPGERVRASGRRGNRKIDRALDRARREGDGLPLMGFLRFLHENQPPPASPNRGKRGKAKGKTPVRPALDVIDSPRDLPDGTNVSIYGRRFSVMKDDDGSALLVEQFGDADPDASIADTGPAPMIVYLDGLDRLPIDRGSYKAGGTDRISQTVDAAAAESRTGSTTSAAPGDISSLPGVQRGLFGRASDGGFSGQQGTLLGLLGQPDEAEAFALPDPDADLRERFRPAERNTGALFQESGGLDARKGKGGAVASAASRIPVKPLPAPASTGRAGTKPAASPGEIILDAAKAFGAGGGRVRRAKPSPGALGTYYPGSTRTVIRYAGDLDVTAHELAHVLDDRYGIVAEWAVPTGTTRDGRPKYGPSPYDIELLADTFQATATKKMSKVMKRAEGVAEYIRARIVNPGAAKTAAPAFTTFIDKKLPASALRAIDTFSDQVRGFAARSASEKVISNIRVNKPTRSVAARIVDAFRGTDPDQWSFTLKDELEAQLDDSFAPVYKAAALAIRLRGLEPLLPSRNPRTLIKNFAGFDAKFADVLDRGPIKADLSRVDGVGGLKWLLEPLGEQTPESMEADYRGVITLLSAERVVEKADNLVKAADMVEALINERDALGKMPPTDIIDGEVTVAERIKEIAREIRTESRKVGYTGPEGKIREWANDRKERLAGFGAGLEPDDKVARDAVAEIKNGDPARYLRLRQAADRYRAFADAGLRYAVAKGRLSKEAYDSIVEANQFYAAFNRVMDDPGEEPGGPGISGGGGGGGAGKGRNLARRQSVTERFKGSTRQIDNPYVNLLTNTHRIMRESDANEAIVSLVNLLDSKREIYKGEPIDLAQIGSKARKGDDKVITVYRKGQAEQWQFVEPVRAALSDWYEIGEENLAFRTLAAMNQFAKASITLSPGFAARQQFRDPVARTILSESGSKPLDHMYFIFDRQGRAEFKDVQSEFSRAGGGLFGHYGVGKEAYYRELDTHIRTGGKDKRTVLSTAQALGRGYTSLLQASETLGRLAEYRKAKAKAINELGYSDLDASLYAAGEARGLQDFAQAGRLIRRLNRYVLFLNPMIRGLSRSISGAKRNPGRFAARMAIYSIAPSIAFKVLGMMSGWDDDLKREPAYYRDFFWHAKIGPELWLRIPKPFELGIPGSAVERGIDWARGVERPFDGFLNSSAKAVTVDPEAFLGPLKPLIEIVANYDFFKGRTIVPEYEVGLDVSLRAGAEKATRVGKIIGDVLRVDPRYIDQAIHGVAPGLGRVVTSAADTGRTDRPSRVPLAARLSGVVGATSADGIPDVRYVLDEARRKGRSADRPYANLQNLLKRWRTESDPAKRVELYNTIAERAKALRDRVDGETLRR